MKSHIKILMAIVTVILIGLAGCKTKKVPTVMNTQIKGKPTVVSTVKSKLNCKDCLAGLLAPLKDFQAFEDTRYTEVTTIERKKWDKEKLPVKILELEGKGYLCDPLPAANVVRWECRLRYNDYRHLSAVEADKKAALEKDGYTCEMRNCVDEQGKDNYVWFCHK